jgi:hypothetical protein
MKYTEIDIPANQRLLLASQGSRYIGAYETDRGHTVVITETNSTVHLCVSLETRPTSWVELQAIKNHFYASKEFALYLPIRAQIPPKMSLTTLHIWEVKTE